MTGRRAGPPDPLPAVGTVFVTTRQVGAFWGGIGPRTRVRVVAHVPAEGGIKIVPCDAHHPIFKTDRLRGLGGLSRRRQPAARTDVALYVSGPEIRDLLKTP